MVPVNSTVQSGKGLDGKLLGAAALNAIAEYLPRAWIDKNSGNMSTVKFVEIAFPPDCRRTRLRPRRRSVHGRAVHHGRVEEGRSAHASLRRDAIVTTYTASSW
jgi:hypothetical protein